MPDVDQIPEDGGRGFRTAGPTADQGDLSARLQLEAQAVEASADVERGIGGNLLRGDAEPVAVDLGDELDHLAGLPRRLDCRQRKPADALDLHVGDRTRPAEDAVGQDDDLRRRVDAVDVRRRIGLGIAEPLGLRKGLVEVPAFLVHLAQDEIGGAIQDRPDGDDFAAARHFLGEGEDRGSTPDRARVPELASVVAAELLQGGERHRERRLVDADDMLAGAERGLQAFEGRARRAHRRRRRLDQKLRLALGDDVDFLGVPHAVGGHGADGPLLLLGFEKQGRIQAAGIDRRPLRVDHAHERGRQPVLGVEQRPLLLEELDHGLSDDAEAGQEDLHPSSTFRIASSVGFTCCIRTGAFERASGSFKPWPVVTQTTVLRPSSFRRLFIRKAIGTALAGSTKSPSVRARYCCASRISSSVTVPASPPESWSAAMAFRQLTGAPMRIAVARVSGWATVWYSAFVIHARAMGAAFSAWTPIILGRREIRPRRFHSRNPFQMALMLPALPIGRTTASGASPRASQTSKARVFCPSSRYGLSELSR